MLTQQDIGYTVYSLNAPRCCFSCSPAYHHTLTAHQSGCCCAQVEFDEAVGSGHSYASKIAAEGVAPRSRQARIGKELAGLAASLPITLSSSVFVRVDQTHMTLWKALITGMHSSFLLVKLRK